MGTVDIDAIVASSVLGLGTIINGNNILLDTICHSDDRREEDELLRTLFEKSR